MPTTGSRLLAVTPSFSLVCLTRMAFSRLAGFSGTAPGSFPNSSNAPFRIAISMSSSLFSRRCRSTSASNSSRRAWSSATFLSIDANASAGPAASDAFGATVGLTDGSLDSTTVLLFPDPDTVASSDFASICRFHSRTVAPRTPSSAAASCDFNRPDATATTASRFSSSGTGPCLSLRWPGASSSIHAMSSSLLFGYPSIRMVRLSRLPYSR